MSEKITAEYLVKLAVKRNNKPISPETDAVKQQLTSFLKLAKRYATLGHYEVNYSGMLFPENRAELIRRGFLITSTHVNKHVIFWCF